MRHTSLNPTKDLGSSKILGLDPGLRTTGWGLIHLTSGTCQYGACGLIKTSSQKPLACRLSDLFQQLTDLLVRYTPDFVAIEEVFVNKNPESSLKLAMARGVVLCAPACREIPVTSYTANHVKKALVGHGHAEKNQVAWVVQQILRLKETPESDAADALAVAICHANSTS